MRAGESIPVDGVVREGASAVDESMLTGESRAVAKQAGDVVYAGTVNQDGLLTCEATKVGRDTLLAGIVRLVAEAQGSKAPIQRLADRVSGIFVPIVVAIAAVTFVATWWVAGDVARALVHAVAVLVIACPCALGSRDADGDHGGHGPRRAVRHPHPQRGGARAGGAPRRR